MATKARLRLTRSGNVNSQGLELLRLALWAYDYSKEIGHVTTVSGQPWAQHFRKAEDSQPGSFEPIPEGYYHVDPSPAWCGGIGDYQTYWAAGLGPVVIDIFNAPGNNTRRAELRIHQDANQSTSPGTAGCIGTQGENGDADFTRLKQIIQWFVLYKIEDLEVDWGLGSVKKPPLPAK